MACLADATANSPRDAAAATEIPLPASASAGGVSLHFFGCEFLEEQGSRGVNGASFSSSFLQSVKEEEEAGSAAGAAAGAGGAEDEAASEEEEEREAKEAEELAAARSTAAAVAGPLADADALSSALKTRVRSSSSRLFTLASPPFSSPSPPPPPPSPGWNSPHSSSHVSIPSATLEK